MINSNNQLRDEHGGLLSGLQVEDYNQGIADFEAGASPPAITSPSYDLGRQRAAGEAAQDSDFWASHNQRHREQMERIRLVIPPEAFAELEARHRAIDEKHARGKAR